MPARGGAVLGIRLVNKNARSPNVRRGLAVDESMID